MTRVPFPKLTREHLLPTIRRATDATAPIRPPSVSGSLIRNVGAEVVALAIELDMDRWMWLDQADRWRVRFYDERDLQRVPVQEDPDG